MNSKGFFQKVSDLTLHSTNIHSGWSIGHSSFLHGNLSYKASADQIEGGYPSVQHS